ncbi:unnamed protein product [Vicia faba]|uniref:Uncharacterized protein n=1 Tax=Vicia faba TaxID=3906 RepID=A0AAV1AHH1_VICFA|nr:unnamed protein product [Vicia faba]
MKSLIAVVQKSSLLSLFIALIIAVATQRCQGLQFVNGLEIGSQLHVELIIQDAKRHKIQVITSPSEFNHWMEVLTEQQTYTLYNGELLKNDLQLNACDNDLNLLFNIATNLCKNQIHNIPPYKLYFNPIFDFLCGSYKHDQLYG